MSNHKDRFRRDIVTPPNYNMTLNMNILNKQIDVLQTAVNDSSQASCTITNGDVKCTNIVYNNPKVWKFSQNRVQKQILSLQTKLDKLKEIQKHLETKRPNFEADNEDDKEVGEEEVEEEDEDVEDAEEDQNEKSSVLNVQWNPRSVNY